jgi:hypothetical protein
VRLVSFAFQACSFNHSDISPLWNQRMTSGLTPIIAHAASLSLRPLITRAFNGLRAVTVRVLGNCVRPPNVPRSLTVIAFHSRTPLHGSVRFARPDHADGVVRLTRLRQCFAVEDGAAGRWCEPTSRFHTVSSQP